MRRVGFVLVACFIVGWEAISFAQQPSEQLTGAVSVKLDFPPGVDASDLVPEISGDANIKIVPQEGSARFDLQVTLLEAPWTRLNVGARVSNNSLDFQPYGRWMIFPKMDLRNSVFRAVELTVPVRSKKTGSDTEVLNLWRTGKNDGLKHLDRQAQFEFLEDAYFLTRTRSKPYFDQTNSVQRLDVVPAYYLVVITADLAHGEETVQPSQLAQDSAQWLERLVNDNGSYFRADFVTLDGAKSALQELQQTPFKYFLAKRALDGIEDGQAPETLRCAYYAGTLKYFDGLSEEDYREITKKGDLETYAAHGAAACAVKNLAMVARTKNASEISKKVAEIKSVIDRLVRGYRTAGVRQRSVESDLCVLSAALKSLGIPEGQTPALPISCRLA